MRNKKMEKNFEFKLNGVDTLINIEKDKTSVSVKILSENEENINWFWRYFIKNLDWNNWDWSNVKQ
jgi:hypothetical protein